MALESIQLLGVRQNNLKNIDVSFPLGKLIVVTGLSGSGKSSLVFETLHAEGQRRYVETFSPYTRQFLEMLDKPDVETVHNIRPSIAIEQTHTVKTSRSTVGTMTELCDYFKVWFSHQSELIDPASGKTIRHIQPATLFKDLLKTYPSKTLLICFKVEKPEKLEWESIINSLNKQGYTRVVHKNKCVRIEDLKKLGKKDILFVIQDRVILDATHKKRFIEAAKAAFHFGQGILYLFDENSKLVETHTEGLISPVSGKRYRPAHPNLFSFNSPMGACPLCRGFGRVIDIDYSLVIPDTTLSIDDGAIRPFQGSIFSESYKDLKKVSKRLKIRTDTAWKKLTQREKKLVLEGELGYGTEGKHWPHAWYGIQGFFKWVESKVYKMHMRVFLSKYRTYTKCPQCNGERLQEESLNWKWRGKTLPELYCLPIEELLSLIEEHHSLPTEQEHSSNLAIQAIRTRLRYLNSVGLGYLSLDRTSRTLSGGESQRVHLTRCLGTSLTDTLFVLDEPSIGLHAQNIHHLIDILKQLTDQGNTVVVVEHDEAVMHAADHIIEIGPKPGAEGGRVHFSGTPHQIKTRKDSLTGAYLSHQKTIPIPKSRRTVNKQTPQLSLQGICKHNLKNVDVEIPLQRMVGLSGVSGSGKSTLLNHALYQGLQQHLGKPAEDPATIEHIKAPQTLRNIALVDQSPISKTPRSNPILYIDGWDPVRMLFAKTPEAEAACFTTAHFSFNSGQGRCEHCQGLGFEKTEMQFLADIFTTCPICDGKRFKQEVLNISWQGKNVSEILSMTVDEALHFFEGQRIITHKLEILQSVGLGYLPLGQPLNTLSGGESQRIRLVKYFSHLNTDAEPCLLLLDEPTTGLHRHDVAKLLEVLHRLVDEGHSVIVIEHQLDVLASADWLIELGPEAGSKGGKIVAKGTPEAIIKKTTTTAKYLKPLLFPHSKTPQDIVAPLSKASSKACPPKTLEIVGAREHNLKNINLNIPHRKLSVVTGVSGSGKSSLAFDIVFSEGQRRYMESLSSYARQFVEQVAKPNIDSLTGIPPTVAIEQRVTRGSRKSTVATVTEVAQYLRLLYAKIGIQYSPESNTPVVSLSPNVLLKSLEKYFAQSPKKCTHYLCAPLVRARKGHYQPLAQWAEKQGYTHLRIDGKLTSLSQFKPLDRYKEHDIELVVTNFKASALSSKDLKAHLNQALLVGKNSCFVLTEPSGKSTSITWFSTERTDPISGEAFPELDPKHFSWNSPKGWCPSCRGHGQIYPWMLKHEDYALDLHEEANGQPCPECQGARLNRIARHVKLIFKGNQPPLSLPELLQSTPEALLSHLNNLKLDAKSKRILQDIYPQVKQRLRFMNQVGLEYLTLDRSSNTLSGGEAQRIRLAAQLGSQLSGVLYVLDEPSIGLHAKDNEDLIKSLHQLREQGNTLLVVEHDEDTLRAADHIIDLGPGAGIHGGSITAEGSPKQVLKNKHSITAQCLKDPIAHPLRGEYREIPRAWSSRSSKDSKSSPWLVLRAPHFRNLKGDTLCIPKGKLSVLCGLSGAGKSTLVRAVLKPTLETALKKRLHQIDYKQIPSSIFPEKKGTKPPFKDLLGISSLKQVIEIDQEPIGKTPRSIPATYIGAMDLIREAFAQLPEARIHGYTASFFSFNTKGGRCEACKGAGRIKLEMNFLPDTYIPCEDCNGSRYGPELYDIRWNGKNIADILAMSFEEAAQFFSFHPKLRDMFSLMVETGLGYIQLGQSSPTLSGGEAQRLKMVSELTKGLPTFKEKSRGTLPTNLYILEEPTIGLHLHDCKRLIELLHRLVDQGHTVIVIEHHLDLIAEADYIVELGPKPGESGGKILYQGPISGLLKQQSPTTPFLKKHLMLH